jgi:DNA polymerase
MKASEKQLIYTLLKTADAYECGYTRDKFAGEPVFHDDVEAASQSESSSEKPAQTIESHALSLDELNAKILRCTRCGLARTRNNVVPGMGVEHPQVLVVGEGPGHDEDMQGLPFVGKAGVLLDRMLAAIGLDRKTNCYIANIVKCRPPENRNPLPDEQAACYSFLEAQIHLLKPRMILCMGKIAIEKITGQNISINAQHGEFFEYNGIPVMPTYHPSALLRNEELKRPAWEDLKKFKRRLDEINTN